MHKPGFEREKLVHGIEKLVSLQWVNPPEKRNERAFFDAERAGER